MKDLGNKKNDRIDMKEFREKGYLQEVNRQFLHPLGLAIEVVVDDNGNETLGGVWDYREDPEGIIYDIKNSDEERQERFRTNAKFIESEFDKHISKRMSKLGFGVETLPKEESEWLKKYHEEKKKQ